MYKSVNLLPFFKSVIALDGLTDGLQKRGKLAFLFKLSAWNVVSQKETDSVAIEMSRANKLVDIFSSMG